MCWGRGVKYRSQFVDRSMPTTHRYTSYEPVCTQSHVMFGKKNSLTVQSLPSPSQNMTHGMWEIHVKTCTVYRTSLPATKRDFTTILDFRMPTVGQTCFRRHIAVYHSYSTSGDGYGSDEEEEMVLKEPFASTYLQIFLVLTNFNICDGSYQRCWFRDTS